MTAEADSERFDTRAASLEPTLHGHHVVWNYSTRFWLPLLGPTAWATWQALIGFCYGEKDSCWPSISLLADMAAGGNRNIIKGRWRTEGGERVRMPGALQVLEDHGLISVEGKPGDQRYIFHVQKEPPLLTPDQLSELPGRLQQMHGALLYRCGLDEETYAERARNGTPAREGRTYGDQRELEEQWRRVLSLAAERVSPGNFNLYLADTRAYDFDLEAEALYLECPSPMVALAVEAQFETFLRRLAAELCIEIDGRRIARIYARCRRTHT